MKKKASQIRKSANQSAYGMMQNFNQNAYEFLANTNIALFTGKARAPKAVTESRLSKQEGPSSSSSVLKNVVTNMPHTSHQHYNNNTSQTTMTSNRRQGNQGEILSAKKHSH